MNKKFVIRTSGLFYFVSFMFISLFFIVLIMLKNPAVFLQAVFYQNKTLL
jgi:hypothetical protein